jgi:hypothetical protein
MSDSTKTDPYSRQSLSRLDRRDVEFGLQLRLMIFESHVRTYLAAVASSRKLIEQRHRPLPARLRRIAGCLELAEDAWAALNREARTVGKIIDFLTGDEAGATVGVSATLEAEREASCKSP